MDLDRIRSILELVALADRLARQFARLTCGNKAGTQGDGHGHTDHKAAGLRSYDLGNAHVGKMLGQRIHHGLQGLGIAKERCDVLKDDSGLGIVGDIDDMRFEVVHG